MRRYALRDDQWERIETLLPGRVSTGAAPEPAFKPPCVRLGGRRIDRRPLNQPGSSRLRLLPHAWMGLSTSTNVSSQAAPPPTALTASVRSLYRSSAANLSAQTVAPVSSVTHRRHSASFQNWAP